MPWTEIVRAHGPPVYRAAWRILGHVQDCEDVVQEVFIEAHALYAAGEVTHWPAFLHRLATFRAIDALRRRRRAEPLDAHRIADDQSTPEQRLVATELEDRVREVIASLPERQAAVFCLTHFEDRSHRQVAELLDISENAVAIALHKARRTLRARLCRPSEEQPS